jgi:hypothetical protein
LALIGELFHAIETVKGNKEQCKALGMRAKRVTEGFSGFVCLPIFHQFRSIMLSELQRLPRITQQSLADRGVFVQLHEMLRSAAEFCGEFSGRNVLRRMLTYRADAERFDDFNRRLSEVVQDAELTLTLDQRAWRDAQEADNKTVQLLPSDLVRICHSVGLQWDAMLTAMESGFSGVNAGVRNVSASVDAMFGKVDNVADQLAETKALVENLLKLQSLNKNGEAPVAAASGAFLHDMLAMQNTWEINPREIKFDQKEDEFGMLRPVSLGEGAFGEVHRGRSLLVCEMSTTHIASPLGVYRGQAVAVKTIKFRLPSDHTEFLKEVSAMNKLHRPNIGKL